MGIIDKQKIIIAGPCSAESEEQMMHTAIGLKKINSIDVFRAGIWKPRSKPGGFEGAGEQGLKWLQKVKKAISLPVAIEVANPNHVEMAIKYGVDILWIGARTTVNPFIVQEISEALKGMSTEVLIKNPINADINLWIGALERIKNANINNIGLVHRGFTSFGNDEYRNAPFWQIPIEMKRLFPEIPMICDPSHIGGKRYRLQNIIQKSLNLDYNGLMIESHFNPDIALTDADQQLSPSDLAVLLDNIEWKSKEANQSEYNDKINVLREELKELDDELLSIFYARMNISRDIGALKKKNNLTILQTKYWDRRLNYLMNLGQKYDLDPTFLKTVLENIHLESIRFQNEARPKK